MSFWRPKNAWSPYPLQKRSGHEDIHGVIFNHHFLDFHFDQVITSLVFILCYFVLIFSTAVFVAHFVLTRKLIRAELSHCFDDENSADEFALKSRWMALEWQWNSTKLDWMDGEEERPSWRASLIPEARLKELCSLPLEARRSPMDPEALFPTMNERRSALSYSTNMLLWSPSTNSYYFIYDGNTEARKFPPLNLGCCRRRPTSSWLELKPRQVWWNRWRSL